MNAEAVMNPGRASARLRLWLRICALVFAGGAVLFAVFPLHIARLMNSTGDGLGFSTHVADGPAYPFWIVLAVAYMVLVTAFSYEGQRGTRVSGMAVRFLMTGKATSSLMSLVFFLAAAHAYAYLVNFVVDGVIVLVTWALYRGARSELA
ncbi:MAG: hypothetical protein ACYDAY_05990 [Candidatus Dormibacteria bacterium]